LLTILRTDPFPVASEFTLGCCKSTPCVIRGRKSGLAAKHDGSSAIRQKLYDGTPAKSTLGIKSVTSWRRGAAG
jgi:hypothetical protein